MKQITNISEVDNIIKKFGALEKNKPPFVIAGLIELPTTGWNGGILALAMTEWDAYNIRRILSPYGDVLVKRTEHHPDGETFDIPSVTMT